MRKRFANIGKPCPGPQVGERQHCPVGAVVEKGRGPLATRCLDCSHLRNSLRTVESQRLRRERKRGYRGESAPMPAGIEAPACGTLAPTYGIPRTPIKRCKTCLGSPHLREQGRLDDYGVPVCLPTMDRCWRCWEPFHPEPALEPRAVLGSSAGRAVESRSW